MKCTHVCGAQTTYLFYTKLKVEPDFLSLADEIAEPRPDINIKVAAFTASEKSINTKFSQSCVLFNAFTLSLLNGASNWYYLNHIPTHSDEYC